MSVKIGRFVEVGTVRGVPLEVGGRRLVPITFVVSVTLPRSDAPAAGLIWAHPVAVEVTDAAGLRRVPIPDVRMRIVLAATFLGASVVLARGLQRTSHRNQEQRRI